MRSAKSRNATVARNDRVTDSCGLGAWLAHEIAARGSPTQSLRPRTGILEIISNNQTLFLNDLRQLKPTCSPHAGLSARTASLGSRGKTALLCNTRDRSRHAGVDNLVDKKVIERRSFFLNEPTA
jgi:hypothetical protein